MSRRTPIAKAAGAGADYLPQPSFVQWSGDVVLTPQQPEAVIWEAP